MMIMMFNPLWLPVQCLLCFGGFAGVFLSCFTMLPFSIDLLGWVVCNVSILGCLSSPRLFKELMLQHDLHVLQTRSPRP